MPSEAERIKAINAESDLRGQHKAVVEESARQWDKVCVMRMFAHASVCNFHVFRGVPLHVLRLATRSRLAPTEQEREALKETLTSEANRALAEARKRHEGLQVGATRGPAGGAVLCRGSVLAGAIATGVRGGGCVCVVGVV